MKPRRVTFDDPVGRLTMTCKSPRDSDEVDACKCNRDEKNASGMRQSRVENIRQLREAGGRYFDARSKINGENDGENLCGHHAAVSPLPK